MMDTDFQFYRIKGRITDSRANILEDVTVLLKRANAVHETEIIVSDRSNGRGEYYFEESLRIGERLRIEVVDYNNRFPGDSREFTLQQSEDITINFVL